MGPRKLSHNSLEGAGSLRRLTHQVWGQRRRVATFAAALLAVAMGYHVVFGQNGLTAFEGKKQNSRQLHQQFQTLSDENEELKGHVERLQSDPGAIEHQAREELHYTRAGEVIITLPAQPKASSATAATR